MKRSKAQPSSTPDSTYSATFLATAPPPSRPHLGSPAISFGQDYDDVEDQLSPLGDDTNPNHVDRPESLPLFNQPGSSRMSDLGTASSYEGAGGAPRRRGVGTKEGGDVNDLGMEGGLDEDEKRGLAGFSPGRAATRKEKPAYRPPAKTWVSLLPLLLASVMRKTSSDGLRQGVCCGVGT